MSHIKKTEMPAAWPVPRKGKRKRFIAVPSHATSKGISLLFLLRDVLRLVETRKEAKYIALNGMIKVNGVVRKDENFPVQVFDTLNLSIQSVDDRKQVTGDRNWRLEIVNRKFSLKEISEKEVESKIVKISGKKVLRQENRKQKIDNRKPIVQMNLDDGQNFLSKEKFSVGDSVVLNTKEKKIVKILPLKKGAKVEIVLGKHAGEKGELIGFEELVRGRNYEIKLGDKNVRLPYKTILVIG